MHPQAEVIEHEHNGVGKVSHAAEKGQMATDQHGHSLIEFDPAAEARLRRKIDFMIVPTVALLYLFCFIDRANIGNARLAGFEADLGLVGLDYNVVLSVFYVSYIVFEIPANILCKWMGPGWFIPLTSLGFGLVSIFTGLVSNKAQVCGVRFVLGIFEAGMLPGIAYYMSRWYRRAELVYRLALYIVMAPLAGAFGGLLASAILTLDGFGRFHSWQMIFAIEGIITVILAVISFFTLTDRPETARWLSQEEKDLAIARVKSERIGTTQVLDTIDKSKLISGIVSPITLSTSLIFLLDNITVQGLAFFAPTIVRTIYPQFSTIQQQLYTVPPYAVGAFFTLAIPMLSYKMDRRQVFMIGCAPFMMLGYAIFLGTTNPQARYGATFIIASAAFSFGPITNAQVSANVLSDTARSSAIGTNVMFGNIGGLISTWSFLRWDGPNYPIGNGLNLATSGTILLLSTLTLLWMKRDNKKREARSVEEELTGLTEEQIQDLDWRHPAFRWAA
ncbi:major facilitator superfamily domain-containing protein [Plectosphaerella plurivora]|uniref:Major facilitator superfamily domain-containing protein n=1 Tax=Plectosphaerella plurivora TaxID=936078 RepID=A0A9P8V7F2_9PEZI|nr:major facilitator superfamily domain-containing protein [Plectosphaerella plurivora]